MARARRRRFGIRGLPNPLGAAGLKAIGEDQSEAAGSWPARCPTFSGVAGTFTPAAPTSDRPGHSADTLLNLGRLARARPAARASCGRSGQSTNQVVRGREDDQLPDNGKLGNRLLAGPLWHG